MGDRICSIRGTHVQYYIRILRSSPLILPLVENSVFKIQNRICRVPPPWLLLFTSVALKKY